MGSPVERFRRSERVVHWVATASFFTLALSGLGLFSRLFHGFFTLFGGGPNAILVHKAAGVVFFPASLWLFVTHRKDLWTFDDADVLWLRSCGGYLSRKPAHFDLGRFNPGQKLFGLFLAGATLALGVTGVLIWLPQAFPRGLVQSALLLHSLAFVGSSVFVLVHGYLGTVGNPSTLDGMLWGAVSEAWARKHHPKWYRSVTGKKA